MYCNIPEPPRDIPQDPAERVDDSNLPFESGGMYGGWGGSEYHGTDSERTHRPVVFAHGSRHDAHDFDIYAERFLARGYSGDALWSITFRQPIPSHDQMARQLDDFVGRVREHTGAETVDVVTHSLSVTGARLWMAQFDRYDWVENFVGIAGANHGTSHCTTTCVVCDNADEECAPCAFISPVQLTPPFGRLYWLNAPYMPFETPGDVTYYTIRGSMDPVFPMNPFSPALVGARRNALIFTDKHNVTRTSERSLELVYDWLAHDR